MKDKIKSVLLEEGIDLCVFLPLEKCKITKRYLLDKAEISSGFAVVFAIPYYTEECDGKRNISAYAVGRDYHFFVKELASRVLPILKAEYPHVSFAMFADHSPIDERHAALIGGLGIMGRNNLLITEKYSSFVFLGELIVGAPLAAEQSDEREPQYCENCGLCQRACPWKVGECEECLSALTQKKGVLNADEEKLLRKYSLWGCDVCTEVCPHTLKAKKNGSIYTPIKFFSENAIANLTYETVAQMSEEEFSKRAFSWRGRDTILRNAEIGDRGNGEKQ